MKFSRLVVLGAISLSLVYCHKKSAEAPPVAKTVRIGMVTKDVSDFSEKMKQGAQKAAAEWGVELTVLMPTNGLSDQKKMITNLSAQGMDGIAVDPVDAERQTDQLKKLAASAKLVTVGEDAPESDRMVHIGTDPYLSGRIAGKLVGEAMPSGGSLAIFVGNAELATARLRRQGLIDELFDRTPKADRFDEVGVAIDGGRFKIVKTAEDQFDQAIAMTNVVDITKANPEARCVVGLADYHAAMIMNALTTVKQLGSMKIVAFDETPETLRAIAAGHVHGAVVQNPYEYGYQMVKFLHDQNAGTGKLPEDKFIKIPAIVVRKDNVEAYQTAAKARATN